MRTLLILFLILTLVIAVAAYAAQALNGVWTAEVQGDELHMNLVRSRDVKRHGSNMMGMTISIASLGPTIATSITAPSADVKFSLDRAAGTLDFEGQFAGGTGAGHFTFTPSDKFVRDMEVLGYRGFRDDHLLLYTNTNFSPETIRGLNAIGYSPTRSELDDVAIFHIDAAYARDMQRLGYPNLTIRNLVDLRIGRITAKTIEEYREVGYRNLAFRELVDFGIHRVTPTYIRELRELGYDNIRARDLIEMKIFKVTPEFIRQLKANGYTGVPIRKLITLKMGGADELFTRGKN